MLGSLDSNPKEEGFFGVRLLLLTFGQFGRKEIDAALKIARLPQ